MQLVTAEHPEIEHHRVNGDDVSYLDWFRRSLPRHDSPVQPAGVGLLEKVTVERTAAP